MCVVVNFLCQLDWVAQIFGSTGFLVCLGGGGGVFTEEISI